jgi:hypothetical protein
MIADRRMKVCEIAAELNRTGPLQRRGRWSSRGISYILRNPAYTGCCAWARTAQKLSLSTALVSPERWITKQAAFASIVGKETFDKVQRLLQKRKADRAWTKSEALRQLGALLKKTGYLSESLIAMARGVPRPTSVRRLFSSLTRMYDLVGYQLPNSFSRATASFHRNQQLRKGILDEAVDRSSGAMTILRAGRGRATLLLDGKVKLSVLLCPMLSKRSGSSCWVLKAAPREADYLTLVCLLDAENRAVHRLYMVRRIEWLLRHQFRESDPWLAKGLKVDGLSQIRDAVHRLMESSLSASSIPS